MAGPSEQAFETAICDSLTSSGGYTSVKVGNAADREVASAEVKNHLTGQADVRDRPEP